ncbi:MAG: DUF2782 domain-containing protein [Pseudoxanthomonas suwonensis]|nr:MAG: DUF2782 domain-containing protein [Pseudoxanthomonas suwonensis]
MSRLPLSLPMLLLLAACASTGARPDGIPADAEEAVRTMPNGDVITEYRVAGQMRAVKVVPARGPTYYLYDRDGDGLVDKAGDNPPQTYYELFKW